MQDMLDYFDQIIKELAGKIEDVFQERQLFVMFESVLGCNIATDHISPKNVYPLFEKQIVTNIDAFAAKIRCKVIETFRNELETYASIINNKNNEVYDIMKAVEEREYLLKGLNDLQPQFRDRIEQEFKLMKKEIHRLMGLLGQKANLNEIELSNMAGDETIGTLKARKQIKEFRTKISMLINERDELQAQISKHQQEQDKQSQQIKELQIQIQRAKEKCQNLEKELISKKPPLVVKEAQTDIAYQFIDELYKFYTQYGQDAESLQNQIRTIQEQYKQQQSDMDDVALSKKQAEKTLEAQRRKAQQEGEHLSADIRTLGAEKSQIQQQYLELKQYVDKELPLLTQEVQDLKSQNASLDKKNNELYAQIDDLTAQLKLLTAENESLCAKAVSIGKMKMPGKHRDVDGHKALRKSDPDNQTSFISDSEESDAQEVSTTDDIKHQSKKKPGKNCTTSKNAGGPISDHRSRHQQQQKQTDNSIQLQDGTDDYEEQSMNTDMESDVDEERMNKSPKQSKQYKKQKTQQNKKGSYKGQQQQGNNNDSYQDMSPGRSGKNQGNAHGFTQEEFDQQVALEVQHRLQIAAIDDQFRQQIDKLAIVEVGVQYDSENPDRCTFESVDYSILQKAVQNGIHFDDDDEEGEQFQVDENGNKMPINKNYYKNPIQSCNDQFNAYSSPGQQQYQNAYQQQRISPSVSGVQPGQQPYAPANAQMPPQQLQQYQQQQGPGGPQQGFAGQSGYMQPGQPGYTGQPGYAQGQQGQYAQGQPDYIQGQQSFQGSIPQNWVPQYDKNGQLVGYQTPEGFVQTNGQQIYNSTDPLVPLPQLQKNSQSIYNNASGQPSYNGQVQQYQQNGQAPQYQGNQQSNILGTSSQYSPYNGNNSNFNGQPPNNGNTQPTYVTKDGQPVVYKEGPNGPGFYNEKGEFISDGKDNQITQVPPSGSNGPYGNSNIYGSPYNNNGYNSSGENGFNANQTSAFAQMQGKFGSFTGMFSDRQQLLNQEGPPNYGGININLATASLGSTSYHDPNDPRYMTSEQLRAERERQREIVFEKARRAKEAEMLEREMLSYKRVFADYNPSYLERVEFEQPEDADQNIKGLKVKGTSIVIKGIKLQAEVGENGEEKQTVTLLDGQQIPLEGLYISIDKEYIIDAYGNKLLEDGYFRDKTNNIITDYKAHTLVHQKQFVRKLQESQAVKNVLKGHKLNAYIRKMYEIKQNQLLEHQRQMENMKRNYGRSFLVPGQIHDFGGLYISYYGPNPNVYCYGTEDLGQAPLQSPDGRLLRQHGTTSRPIFQGLRRPLRKTGAQSALDEKVRQQWRARKAAGLGNERRTVLMNEQADFSASPWQLSPGGRPSPVRRSPKPPAGQK